MWVSWYLKLIAIIPGRRYGTAPKLSSAKGGTVLRTS
jgi:hypothetical protein